MSWRHELKVSHHDGEYPPELMNLTVSEVLDLLQKVSQESYERVERELDKIKHILDTSGVDPNEMWERLKQQGRPEGE